MSHIDNIDNPLNSPVANEPQAVVAGPPSVPMFDLPSPSTPPPAPAMPAASAPAAPSSPASAAPKRKGLLGALGALGAMLAKFWGVVLGVLFKLKALLVALKFLTFGKLLLTVGTMFLSMLAYSFAFGWAFAVGLVLLIFIHESGHALAARRLGHPVGIMVFVPFMGAFVTSRGGRNVVESAFVGIMGPVFGTLGGLACWALYFVTGHPVWLALAWFCFLMNLLNLTPAPPLDGGWLLPLFSPKLLLPCVGLLLFTFWQNPMVWALAIMSLPRLLHAWKYSGQSAYYKVTARERWEYGLAWGGLAAFLALASMVAHYQLLAHIGR
ncbi:MAG TPA: hypothetical protein VFA07_02750 [Chthonomonadaceae bacterium]|nr:hypothetical protein [Chthonomonadaceae bacterium]